MENITRRGMLAGASGVAMAAALKLPRKIRVAMVGLDGHPGEVISPLPQLPDVEVAAIYDPMAATMERFAKNPRLSGVSQHSDWRKMLDAVKPDVVAVCNANSDHAGVIVDALGRGMHVIAEKPIATEWDDLARVKKAVEQSRTAKFTAMLPMRFDGNYVKLKQIVASGEIGDVIQMDAQKSYQVSSRPQWFFKRKTYGGTMAWIGIHMIDLMIYATGRDFTEASGFQNHIGFPETGDTENVTATVFRLDNGGVALLRMDYLRPKAAGGHGDDRLRIAGTKGIVEFMHSTGVTLMTGTRNEVFKNSPPDPPLFVSFLDHIYNGKAEPIPWKEIYRGHQVALGARDAMEKGRLVKL